MFSVTLSISLAALAVSQVAAQAPTATFPATPLAQKRFTYPTGIPEKVDTDVGLVRGTQYGYNKCDKSTEGQDSKCQTSFVNSLDDFCLWGPPEKDMDVGSHEGEMVAWCTKPGRGTRLIPAGALTGVQFMRTSAYVQVVGFIDQTAINILKGDFGGEMDPHGADLRGNPMGGLIFSNAWGGNNDTYTQAVEWHNFIGGNTFCLKTCDPANPDAPHFCEHIYDRIGCTYNAPNAAVDGQFVSCEGENQDFPGIYTENGVVMTYTQPAESLGVISTMPYQPRLPASSNCVTYTSSALFAALATVVPSGGASPTASVTGSGASGAPTGTAGNTGRGTSAAATGSNTSSASQPGATNAATKVAMSGLGMMGVVFSALFLS